MASTYRPIDAFNFSKAFIKLMPLEEAGPLILDNAMKMFWMAAPWRWTLGNYPVVTLEASRIDYTTVDPTDFLMLVPGAAYISAGADDVGRDVDAVAHIHSTVKRVSALPTQITHPAVNTIRVSPKPSATVTSGTQLITLYKKVCPTITAENSHTAGIQVFDDEWFHVYVSAVLYQAYLFADDGRAGGVQYTEGGQKVFTGQRGVFEANIQHMRETEPMLIQPSPPVDTSKKGK
jgi:hypothetical protein